MTESESENDDLYGDLDDTKLAVPRTRIESTFSNEKSKHNTFILGEENVDYYDADYVKKLKAQIANLQNENETLKRNIGTLYRTAKAELARKDKELDSLRKSHYSAR